MPNAFDVGMIVPLLSLKGDSDCTNTDYRVITIITCICKVFENYTPPLFHPNVRGVSLELDCRCCGSEKRRP